MGRRGPWALAGVTSVAVVALVAVLLARDDRGSSGAGLLADASAAADAHGTARMAIAVRLGDGDLEPTASGTGSVDFESGAGSFDVSAFGSRASLRTDGRTLWFLPDGEDVWLATPADGAGELGALGIGPAQAIALVDLLRGDRDDVEDLSDDEVDRDGARHLRFSAGRDVPPALVAMVPAEVEVWIDDRSLPLRFRLRGERQDVPISLTVDLTDWGSDLELQVPPQGLVRDVEPDELVTMFGGGGP